MVVRHTKELVKCVLRLPSSSHSVDFTCIIYLHVRVRSVCDKNSKIFSFTNFLFICGENDTNENLYCN